MILGKLVVNVQLIVDVPDWLKEQDLNRLKDPVARRKIAEVSVNDMLQRVNVANMSAIVLDAEYRQGDLN